MLTPVAKAALVATVVFAVALVVFSVIQRAEQMKQGGSADDADNSSMQRRAETVPVSGLEEPIVRYNRWLMIFTGALAFFAVVQFGFLIRGDTVATTAADAARRSADIAEETLRLSQGASIGIYHWESRDIEVNKSPFAKAQVANAGHTAAIITDDWSTMTIDTGLPRIPSYGSNPTNVPMPPNGAIFEEFDGSKATVPIVLTQKHFDELIAGQKKMFVWGRITYTDIFKDTWDYGYLIQFAPVIGKDGTVTWRDVNPGIPNYISLVKRPSANARH